MLRFILSVVFLACASWAVMVEAKIPPEVLRPYKEYRAALDAGDKTKAFKSAKKAWEMAEDVLGDSKTTGDLAANFAVLVPETKYYSIKDYNARMKAHKRAVKLASFYPEDQAIDVELDRHIKRIETGLGLVQVRGSRSKSGGKPVYFSEMEAALDKYDRRGSTFEGDMEVLRTRRYVLTKNPEKAIEASARAEAIYANPTDDFWSHYPIMLKLFKGNALRDAENPIGAVLEYQDVMQNMEGKLPADHEFVRLAFTEWVKTRTSLQEGGRLEEAEAAGLCRCWPFEEYKDDVVPLKRIPPVMPRNARRSGHVNVIFDVNQAGQPENIRTLSSTDMIFEKPALKSVAAWVYSPIGHGEAEAKSRKDVAAKITFKLTDRTGRIIPES